MIRCLILATLCLCCNIADAGRPCRTCRKVVKAVQPIAVPQATYVIQNNYPQPLVAQGTTSYASTAPTGYQAAVLPLFDVNRYLHDQQQLSLALNKTQALGMSQVQKIAERVAEIQAPALEAQSRGQAAAMVLDAAGLRHAGERSTSAIVIERHGAETTIRPLTRQEVARLQFGGEPTEPAEGADEHAATPTLLGRFCASCHGEDVAQPKAGLYLSYDANYGETLRARLADILYQVDQQKMPPATAEQPTAEEREALKSEILTHLYSLQKE